MPNISKRLFEIVDALPLKKGMRILEIGCGPGVAAREIVNRVENGYVLAIDRSAKAIELACKNSEIEIDSGKEDRRVRTSSRRETFRCRACRQGWRLRRTPPGD